MLNKLELFINAYFDFNYGIGCILFLIFLTIYLYLPKYGKKSLRTPFLTVVFPGIVFCFYLVLLFGVTLLNRTPKESIRMNLQLFWSYIEVWRMSDKDLGMQIFYNILAFIPMGIFLPLLYPEMKQWKRTVFVGCMVSVFIELNQLIWKCGLCEMDDVFNNTIGTMVGYLFYHILNLLTARRTNAERTKVPH